MNNANPNFGEQLSAEQQLEMQRLRTEQAQYDASQAASMEKVARMEALREAYRVDLANADGARDATGRANDQLHVSFRRNATINRDSLRLYLAANQNCLDSFLEERRQTSMLRLRAVGSAFVPADGYRSPQYAGPSQQILRAPNSAPGAMTMATHPSPSSFHQPQSGVGSPAQPPVGIHLVRPRPLGGSQGLVNPPDLGKKTASKHGLSATTPKHAVGEGSSRGGSPFDELGGVAEMAKKLRVSPPHLQESVERQPTLDEMREQKGAALSLWHGDEMMGSPGGHVSPQARLNGGDANLPAARSPPQADMRLNDGDEEMEFPNETREDASPVLQDFLRYDEVGLLRPSPQVQLQDGKEAMEEAPEPQLIDGDEEMEAPNEMLVEHTPASERVRRFQIPRKERPRSRGDLLRTIRPASGVPKDKGEVPRDVDGVPRDDDSVLSHATVYSSNPVGNGDDASNTSAAFSTPATVYDSSPLPGNGAWATPPGGLMEWPLSATPIFSPLAAVEEQADNE